MGSWMTHSYSSTPADLAASLSTSGLLMYFPYDKTAQRGVNHFSVLR